LRDFRNQDKLLLFLFVLVFSCLSAQTSARLDRMAPANQLTWLLLVVG